MRSILPEFEGSSERIRHNFYLSFLACNFLDQGPFRADIRLPVDIAGNVMTADSLNAFNNDGIQEYGNSIRRHFLNDLVIAYERYSMLMLASHSHGRRRTDPALVNDRHLGASRFEQLTNVYTPADGEFLRQLRHLRNSIVHYNGVYCLTSPLNYTFGTEVYNSAGNEGQNITIQFNNLLWIYNRLRAIVQAGNASYFAQYPVP